MNTTRALLASSILAISCMAFAAAQDPAHTDHPKDQQSAHHQGASDEMHRIMHEGAKTPMKMSGNTDRDFAMMMTMHHQQAIKMAEVEIEHGSNAELKAMAKRMKSEQEKEIQELAKFK